MKTRVSQRLIAGLPNRAARVRVPVPAPIPYQLRKIEQEVMRRALLRSVRIKELMDVIDD